MQFIVLTPERNDQYSGLSTAHASKPVCVESSAVNDDIGLDRPRSRLEKYGCVARHDADDLGTRPNRMAATDDDFGHPPRHRRKIDDARVGHQYCFNTRAVRLSIPKSVGAYELTADTVSATTLQDPSQHSTLLLLDRNDDLAAYIKRNMLPLTKIDQGVSTDTAVLRHQGARPIVDSRVYDARIVPRLMPGDIVFLFDDYYRPPGVLFRYVICGRQSDYPTTDYGNFMLHSATRVIVLTSCWHPAERSTRLLHKIRCRNRVQRANTNTPCDKTVSVSRRLLLLTAFVTMLVPQTSCTRAVDAESSAKRQPIEQAADKIRSITFSSRNTPEPGTLEALRDLGVSHVTLIPFGYQRSHDETTVHFEPNRRWYTESDSGITRLAKDARAIGIGTIIKPHIWIGRYSTSGQTRDAIGFATEDEWRAWETSYQKFILHYARLAQSVGADLFVIGTELSNAARSRPQFWIATADDVRSVYDGKITYAANWWEEYEHIEFWPQLDFVGVQAYFPISDADRPDAASLSLGWRVHNKQLQRISAVSGRPVFFTEIGYRSVSDAAREPWRWASRSEAAEARADLALQADLYRAFFESVWERPWFAGASVWRWHTDSESRGAVRDIDFTPQHKPSQDVIRTWFRR